MEFAPSAEKSEHEKWWGGYLEGVKSDLAEGIFVPVATRVVYDVFAHPQITPTEIGQFLSLPALLPHRKEVWRLMLVCNKDEDSPAGKQTSEFEMYRRLVDEFGWTEIQEK